MRQNKCLRKQRPLGKKIQEQPQTSCKYSTHWQICMILAFVLWGNLHIAVLNPSSVLHFSFTRLASFQGLSWISIEPHKSMTFSNYFLYVQFLFTFEQSHDCLTAFVEGNDGVLAATTEGTTGKLLPIYSHFFCVLEELCHADMRGMVMNAHLKGNHCKEKGIL